MPVYLFTFHTYRSWLPDRKRGYTKRGFGYQPADATLREEYDERASYPAVELDQRLQEIAIAQLQHSCRILKVRLHAVGTDPTHVHVLVSWKHVGEWIEVRRSIRRWLTVALRGELDPYQGTADVKRPVFSRSSSRKKVNNEKHFAYLVKRYLPSHRGVCWTEGQSE